MQWPPHQLSIGEFGPENNAENDGGNGNGGEGAGGGEGGDNQTRPSQGRGRGRDRKASAIIFVPLWYGPLTHTYIYT